MYYMVLHGIIQSKSAAGTAKKNRLKVGAAMLAKLREEEVVEEPEVADEVALLPAAEPEEAVEEEVEAPPVEPALLTLPKYWLARTPLGV